MIPTLGKRPALNGIRGIAVLLVIARHAMPSVFGGAGMIGVGLFFVLSGFLITTLLVEENHGHGRISLSNFYLRRALRLLPALVAMLVVVTIYGSVFTSGTERAHILASVGFSVTYLAGYAAFLDYPIMDGLGPMWSLAVEEQFYLIWPLILVMILRGNRTIPTALLAVSGTLVVSVALRISSFTIWGPEIYELPTTWSDGLLVGCALALLWKAGKLNPDRFSTGTAWACWTLLAALSLWPAMKDSAVTYTFGLTVGFAIAGWVVLLSLQTGPTILQKMLTIRPLIWVGNRSYAIYLWNFILITAIPNDAPFRQGFIVLAVLATFVVAEMSWQLVEHPAIGLKGRFAARKDRRNAA
ncbi:acyltransferase [Rhodococcus sp. 14-2483-1-2]|uniref:acyltransferase family protein n=1 Tax=Rhodococcus sp. 14-2483-1-2 TaxID=2023147 RepID=UPI001482D12E|nr:acyltransferase [Rhodococcus sp. 14-2483-1-2]